MEGTSSNRPRVLHTMMRVRDLDKSLSFYTEDLGMRLLRKKSYEDGRFTLAYLGYAGEDETAVVELTHNWDQSENYQIGNGYGHVAIGVEDIYAFCASLETRGVKLVRKPGPMKVDPLEIAFIEDPDGYKVEIIGLPSFRNAIVAA